MTFLRISLYSKTFQPLDWVGAPLEVKCTVRFNAASSCTFSVDADDEQVPVLMLSGVRAVVEYFYDDADREAKVFLLSGMLKTAEGDTTGAQTRSFVVEDDWGALFGTLLGWPNPAGTITQQGEETAYWRRTGPAETVLKQAVTANASRFVPAVTVAPNLARGASVEASLRFHPLGDRLFPAVDLIGGIGVTVRQSGAGIRVDCFTPDVLDVVLTEESGIVAAGTFSITAPTVTRVIALGSGVSTARVVRQKIDTAAEAAWGIRREAVIDTRDTADPVLMDKRIDEALLAGASTASVSAVLSETEDWRFPTAFGLGDRVSIQLNGAPPITDVVREVSIDWTPDSGLLVTPKVGNVEDSAVAKITKAIRQVGAAQRNQRVSD